MTSEALYSITEVAAKLGVSPATIATWIRLGIAPASRQDELGRNRWTEDDIEAMRRRFQERQAQKRTGALHDSGNSSDPTPSNES